MDEFAATPLASEITRAIRLDRIWRAIDEIESLSGAPHEAKEQASFVMRAMLLFLTHYPDIEKKHAPRVTTAQVTKLHAVLLSSAEVSVRAVESLLDLPLSDDDLRTLFHRYTGKPAPASMSEILAEYRDPKWKNGRKRDVPGARLRAVTRLLSEARALGYGMSTDAKRRKKDRDNVRAALLKGE